MLRSANLGVLGLIPASTFGGHRRIGNLRLEQGGDGERSRGNSQASFPAGRNRTCASLYQQNIDGSCLENKEILRTLVICIEYGKSQARKHCHNSIQKLFLLRSQSFILSKPAMMNRRLTFSYLPLSLYTRRESRREEKSISYWQGLSAAIPSPNSVS